MKIAACFVGVLMLPLAVVVSAFATLPTVAFVGSAAISVSSIGTICGKPMLKQIAEFVRSLQSGSK
jgi:hypothetical protein